MKTKENKTSKVITIGSSPKWRGDKEVTMSREERKAFMKAIAGKIPAEGRAVVGSFKDVVYVKEEPRRYAIHSDGDHKYFVEVGMEGEFEQWIETWESKEAAQKYRGHDYEKNRIDGHFTFTDPRCE